MRGKLPETGGGGAEHGEGQTSRRVGPAMRYPRILFSSETSTAPENPRRIAITLRTVRRSPRKTVARMSVKIVQVWLRTLEVVTFVNLIPKIQRHIDR